MIKNSIIGYGTKKADQFQANPLNWRKHPQEQRSLVAESLRELGWIDVVIENISTGHLIDGHERVMQALENNDDVPYIQVELTENEEKLALGLLDTTTGMAETDGEQLKALLDEIKTDNPIFQKMFADLAEKSSLPEFEGFKEKEVDENIDTETQCPKCGYRW